MDPLELRRKRAGLIEQMRALISKADEEKRDLSGEEEESFKKMEEDVRKYDGQIKREEGLRSLEADLGESLNEPHAPAAGEGDAEDRSSRSPRATDEYRKLFWECMVSRHNNPPEARDLFKADDPSGGYLVPEAYETELIKALEEINIMRTLATVRMTDTLSKIPIRTGKPVAQWLGEKGTFAETDMDFGQYTMDAHKGGCLVKVSNELLSDSFANIEAELREGFQLAQGDLEEAAFVAGDGHEKPRGVILDAQTGVTAAAVDEVAADEIIELKYSLKKPYRKRARWLMNDTTVLAIAMLKDGNGQYIWRAGLQANEPDVLLGSPLESSSDMPELATGNSTILYGDFSYYRVQDRVGISIQKLVELYAETDQVGFIMKFRTDGRLMLPEAVKALVMA